jgi:tetratricopeptide (TPR) repeat protein
MPDPAVLSAKRRQAWQVTAFMVGVAGLVSGLFHVVHRDAVAFRRGENAWARGEASLAADHYLRAWDLGFASPRLSTRLSRALLAAGRTEEALACWERLATDLPQLDRALLWEGIGVAQAAGRPDLALRLHDALGPRETWSAHEWTRRADVLQQADEVAAAVMALREALARVETAELRLFLGQLLARIGLRAEALAEIERALELDSDLAAARLARARVLAGEGQWAAAARAYRVFLGDPGE